MQVHFGTELLKPEWNNAVVSVGTFDGVHLGHRSVIESAANRAAEMELPVIVATFDRHPQTILNPVSAPKAIFSLTMNLEQLRIAGVGLAVVLPFNAWLSRMPAREFLNSILFEQLRASVVVVGEDFAMGNSREGTPEWLSRHLETIVVPQFQMDGHRVSSTEIRTAICGAEIEKANKLLGREFEIQGFVVHGQKLGRQLGYPTINVARSFDQIMPGDGVYAGHCLVSGACYSAAISIGTRPAVDDGPRSIEAYLLDFPGESLYGEPVRLKLGHYLRPEQNFDSLDLLKAQIGADVVHIRSWIEESAGRNP